MKLDEGPSLVIRSQFLVSPLDSSLLDLISIKCCLSLRALANGVTGCFSQCSVSFKKYIYIYLSPKMGAGKSLESPPSLSSLKGIWSD